jgi:hypothetical protein
MFDKKGHQEIEVIADPKTGEMIHRVAIDPKGIEKVNTTITKHQETMNAFVINSQSFFQGLKIQLELMDKIKLADDAIKKTLTEVQKESKLDPKKPWAFNLQLKTFEYRTPPDVDGVPLEQVKKGQSIAV